MKAVTAMEPPVGLRSDSARAVIAGASEAIHAAKQKWIASSLALLAITNPGTQTGPKNNSLIDIDASAIIEL